jgi:hypothetical protein
MAQVKFRWFEVYARWRLWKGMGWRSKVMLQSWKLEIIWN